ncbi:MAG: PorP/SprF family type IX secretion system membrane protein [Saprospiraceae bacterium]
MPRHFTSLFSSGFTMLRTLTLVLLVASGVSGSLCGQDFHYSQFYNAPLRYNPALTGIFGGDVRFAGNYKSQWASVPVDYKTFSVSVDKKFIRRTDREGFLAAGLGLNYDRSGDGRLTWADADLNLSYTRYLSKKLFITLGGQGALVQRSFQPDELRFNKQFDDGRGIYDPSLANGENFSRTSHTFLDFGAGINIRFQSLQRNALIDRNDRRTKLDVGVAMFHITRPDQSFIEDVEVGLARRISPYAMLNLQVIKPLDVVANLTYQMQNEYRELVGMGGVRLHLNRRLGHQYSVMVGAGVRHNDFQDAWFPTAEVRFNNLEVAVNYDFNVSYFDIATQNKGGFEISARYFIKKIRLPRFKNCPII